MYFYDGLDECIVPRPLREDCEYKVTKRIINFKSPRWVSAECDKNEYQVVLRLSTDTQNTASRTRSLSLLSHYLL